MPNPIHPPIDPRRAIPAILIPRSPHSCPSNLSSPASTSLSLSPSLSPHPHPPHPLKRHRSSPPPLHWDATSILSCPSISSDDSETDDALPPPTRVRVSPLTIGLSSVTVRDSQQPGHSPPPLPPFSLSASSAFLPCPPAAARAVPALQGGVPPLHPVALHAAAHPGMRFPYPPPPLSLPLPYPLPHSPYLLGPSPTGLFTPHHIHAVPLSQAPSAPLPPTLLPPSTPLTPLFLPPSYYPNPPPHCPVLPIYPSPFHQPLPTLSPPTTPFTHPLPPPWPTSPRLSQPPLRYLVHFPDDSSHGAQGGLYQPGKPSLLCITLVQGGVGEGGGGGEGGGRGVGRGVEEEVRLPVKVALKPTVKESATVRRFDELALHPRALWCDSTDLGAEEGRWGTAAGVPDPAYLLLRQDWKGPVAVVHVPRWGRQQREVARVSPLHLLPVQDGTLAHTQTRGRGKTEGARKDTAQLYLSMVVDGYYELRCHMGWRVVRMEMRHFKAGGECGRVALRFSGMEADTRVEDAVGVIECLSGGDGEQVRRQAKLNAGHDAWKMAQAGKAGKGGGGVAAVGMGPDDEQKEQEGKAVVGVKERDEVKEEMKEEVRVVAAVTPTVIPRVDVEVASVLGSMANGAA